jgi:hypothetical protein
MTVFFRLAEFVIILSIGVGNAIAENGRSVEYLKIKRLTETAVKTKLKHDQNAAIPVNVKHETAAHKKLPPPPVQLPPTDSPLSQPTRYQREKIYCLNLALLKTYNTSNSL